MRLLYVTESVPNRDVVHGEGSSLIPFEVISHLPAEVRIDLLTFAGQVKEAPEEIGGRCDRVIVLNPQPERSTAARSLLTGLSRGAIARDTISSRQALKDMSEAADVTLLHGPSLIPLWRHVSGPLVIQAIDPWSRRQHLEADLSRGVARLARRIRAGQSLRAERKLPRKAVLLTVSQADAVAWSHALGREVSAIGLGVDHVSPSWRMPEGPPTVCFVGSLNYAPNIESAQILVGELAPIIRERIPDMRVVIAGRQPSPAVIALASEHVEIRGNVPNIQDVFASSHVAVFPDRSGLGVRNTVGEALAAGIPVVASTAAAREQPMSPRLQVGESIRDLAEQAISVLTRGHAPEFEPTGTSWAAVADSYLTACRAAINAKEGNS